MLPWLLSIALAARPSFLLEVAPLFGPLESQRSRSLMLPTTDTAWTILVTVALAVIAGLVAWWRRSKPARDRNRAMQDAILGKPPVLDRAGGVLEHSQRGLVNRMDAVEETVVRLADQQDQINALRTSQDSLRSDVEILKSGVVEKAAMRVENAALFDMIAKRDSDVIDAQEEP